MEDDDPPPGNWLIAQIKNNKVAAIFSETILCRIGMHRGTWTRDDWSDCSHMRFCIYCGRRQQRKRHIWPPKAAGEYIADGSCETILTCLKCGEKKYSGIRHVGRIHPGAGDNRCKRCGKDMGNDWGYGLPD